MDEDVMAECKYVTEEICRAPLILMHDISQVTVDGQMVDFGIGQHFLRCG